MTASVTRAQLLSRGAKSGATLLVAGSALGPLVAEAAADPLPATDLDNARVLVAVELLASDFYSRALKTVKTSAGIAKYLKRASFNEREHYRSLSRVLTEAGVTPAVPGDFDFTYPKGTFESEKSIVRFARMLEPTMLGAYLTVLGATETGALRATIAPIAACEAQHSAYFTAVSGGKVFGLSFPPAVSIDQVAKRLNLDLG